MTEKRFDYQDEYITRNGGVIFTAKTVNDAELISKTFNRLIDENEKLKKQISSLCFILSQFDEEKVIELMQENETYDQCPRLIPCPFCSCIMKLVLIEEKQVIYRCPCCKNYKHLQRKEV